MTAISAGERTGFNALTQQAGDPAATAPYIELAGGTFDPWRIQSASHRLCDHPLLQLNALVDLGERLESKGSIRSHSNAAKPGTPFNSAPDLFPNVRSAPETVRSIRDAKAWMSLLNVQIDPAYRTLVADVLDSIKPLVDQYDPGMCHRAGWIFISSPGTVTPFHFDKEHNFIMQVHGRKRIYVWDHDDTIVASEHSRDLFHHRHERYLLRWKEEFRERAHVFDLEPGQGAYMPSTSPHMVENGDGPSVTISFTYYTDATRRDSSLHKAHALLRRVGITPPPVGRYPVMDALARLLMVVAPGSEAVGEFAEIVPS
jgi:hypothetical protein